MSAIGTKRTSETCAGELLNREADGGGDSLEALVTDGSRMSWLRAPLHGVIEPGFGAIVHLKHLLDPSELTRLVARCHPCSCSKRPQGDRRIGIVRPIGLRPQLVCPLVIGAHEFRPGQRNDDVVALKFDVEFVIVHHQADTNARGPSIAPTSL
jgi:hypothetical protein